LNFVDYVLIAIVGLSMVLSLWRGFVREMISLIGLVLAFLAASRLSGTTGAYLGQWIDNATIADGAGFALIFIVGHARCGPDWRSKSENWWIWPI